MIPFLNSEDSSLLILIEPLIGFFAFRSKFKEDSSIPTAGIRVGRKGIEFYYNPEFIQSLNTREKFGIIAHEYLHVFLEHCTKRTSLDPAKHHKENIAKDLAINPLIVKQSSFSLPSSALLPAEPPFNFSDGFNAEQYYELLDKQFTDDELEEIQLMDDHGGHGEDGGHGKIEVSRIAREFQRTSNRGNNIGNLPGSLGGDILQRLMALEDNCVNWTLEAKKFLTQVASPKRKFTWKRPSRRYPFPAQGQKTRTRSKALVIIDTSGSMSDNYLQHIGGQLNIMSRIMQLDVIQCDTQVNSHEKKYKEKQELDFAGRGGTVLKPAFLKADEEKYKAIICFTDGYLFDEKFEDIHAPILWVVVNNEQFSPAVGRVINVEWKEGDA